MEFGAYQLSPVALSDSAGCRKASVLRVVEDWVPESGGLLVDASGEPKAIVPEPLGKELLAKSSEISRAQTMSSDSTL